MAIERQKEPVYEVTILYKLGPDALPGGYRAFKREIEEVINSIPGMTFVGTRGPIGSRWNMEDPEPGFEPR